MPHIMNTYFGLTNGFRLTKKWVIISFFGTIEGMLIVRDHAIQMIF